jgi:chromosome partitioning protein
MPIVSVINYKGGVGKTTVTANLAAQLAYLGKKVLLLDLDPQTSLTFSFISPEWWSGHLAEGRTVKAWFDSFASGRPMNLRDLIITPLKVKNRLGPGLLHLIASHLGLINVDLELATELGGANLKQSKANFLRVHKRLADGLASLASDYDIVLMDCPPNFNITTKNAIVASDFVLIPAKPDYLSTLGIDYLRRNLDSLVSDYNEYASLDLGVPTAPISPAILGVVFTMVSYYGNQPIAAARPFINQTRSLGLHVYRQAIRENKTIFADAAQVGVPVVLTHYGNPTHDNVVAEIEQFTTQFLESLSQT